MRVAVIQFPGSNADFDALHALTSVMGAQAHYVFYREPDLGPVDAVVIPGGFSFGDYLRAGALARFSPVIGAVEKFARAGGPVLGICNGFQVLTEMGLLPGALAKNAHQRFECRSVFTRVEGTGILDRTLARGDVLRLPVAHADGRYMCDEATRSVLEGEGRVALRYCTEDGADATSYPDNPNGSMGAIAGIYNEQRNVLGMMPHPERACETLLGNDQGRRVLEALLGYRKGSA